MCGSGLTDGQGSRYNTPLLGGNEIPGCFLVFQLPFRSKVVLFFFLERMRKEGRLSSRSGEEKRENGKWKSDFLFPLSVHNGLPSSGFSLKRVCMNSPRITRTIFERTSS